MPSTDRSRCAAAYKSGKGGLPSITRSQKKHSNDRFLRKEKAMAAIHTSKSGGVKTLSTTEIFMVSKYSKAARMPTGLALKSRPFDFHDRSWRLKVYPTGHDSASRDFVSLFLKCRTEPFRCLSNAKITMEIMDFRTGAWTVFDGFTAGSSLAAADDGFSMGYARFAKRRELEASGLCIQNDTFTVKITMVVDARPPKPAFTVPRIFTTNKDNRFFLPASVTPRLPPPPARASTASTSSEADEVVTGSHKVTIEMFSQKKRVLGFGECVRSRQFSVGGSNWYIKVYPNGSLNLGVDTVGFVLARGRSSDPATTAEFTFELGSAATRSDRVMHTFDAAHPEQVGFHRTHADLEPVLRQDTLVVRVGLGVFPNGAPPSPLLAEPPAVAVPPRAYGDFLWLLKSEEGSDVTFAVGYNTFRAHACILAAQSPVLRAELRALREDAECAWRYVEVDAEAVTPEAFEALLHVAYTDHLPDMNRAEPTDERVHAFVLAAEKYEMERLKLRTEEWVCSFVTVSTVAEFLSMAVRYDCKMLRDACVKFATPDHVWKHVKETYGFDQLRASCPDIVRQIESKQRQY